MRYSKFTLGILLALSLHSICYATTVSGIAGAEGAENTVSLIQDSPGHVGQILVSTAGDTVQISQANSFTLVNGYSQPPAPPVYTPASQIYSAFGDVISNQPSAPGSSTLPGGQPLPAPAPTGIPTGSSQGSGGTSASAPLPGAGAVEPSLPQVLTALVTGTIPNLTATPVSGGQWSGANSVNSSSGSGGQSGQPVQLLPPQVPNSATLSDPSGQIVNQQADQVATLLTDKNMDNAAAAAAYFFAKGSDAQTALRPEHSTNLEHIAWGEWGSESGSSPLPFGPFVQPYGVVYSPNSVTDMTAIQNGSAVYTGLVAGSVSYGSTAQLSTDITMTANFANNTLSFSGAGISGSGSWNSGSAAINGQIAYSGHLNDLAANLSGRFAGSFFGNTQGTPLEVGAAWAMSGKVGTNSATAAGILAATFDHNVP